MKRNWFVACVLGVVAAILYFVSMADYAYPGIGAQLMVWWRGLDAMDMPRYPLMSAFGRILGGGNVLAPVCGVVSVVALFHLVAAFVTWRVRGEDRGERREEIGCVAGAVAAVVFMLTPAVRAAATHLEPRMFAFTWMLVSISFAFPFLRQAIGATWLFPILFGVMTAFGFLDSALVLAFAPFLVAIVAMVAIRNEKKPYLPVLLFAIVGFVTVLSVLAFLHYGFVDFLRTIATELREYRSTPGWLFVLLFSTVPFVVALFSSGKAFGEAPGLVPWLFHGAMAFVAILAIATPLSPSKLMEPYGIPPVATSAFAAAVAGYLIAYAWLNRESIVGLVLGGLLALVMLVTVVWNLFAFEGGKGAFADAVARKIVDDLGARRWFVTDGLLDDHIRLVAAERRKDIILVSLARDLDERYLSDLADIIRREGIGGSKNGALRLSATLGVLPFLQDWFAADPSTAKDVAIFGAPDLWQSAGIKPVPEFLFFGADETREPDWSAWRDFDGILHAPKDWGSYRATKITDPVDRMRLGLRRHVGFVANNRGVYLQDRKRDDEAFAMYELVLNEIDRDNISTIFNEIGMVNAKHGGALDKRHELERMIKSAVDDRSRRYLLWRLGTYYGYIRDPDIFIRLGYAWARSGRPGDALRQVRRAIDFVSNDRRLALFNMMAALYASENEQQKSRRIYEALLKRNDKDHDALVGMMRLELLDGNGAKALEYLQRAAKSAKDGPRANVELAMVAMMQNDLSRAKGLVRKVIDADPKNMQAWSMLSAVTMQQIDEVKDASAKAKLTEELEKVILPAMEKQARDQFDYYLQATKGFLALRKGEDGRRKAREAFILANRARPDIATTRDMVLGLDISLNDKDGAERHARDVLRRNRNAPLANYIMGSLALGQNKYEEAEAFLRKAADAPQPVALALNDLAELLRRTRRYDEAEAYARKAVKVSPNLYAAWDTLGAVLMDVGRDLHEAESAIRRACELSKDRKTGREADVRVLVSLARVQLKTGDREHAKMTIRKVRMRIDELSEGERKEFEAITKFR